jgi:hypothetical protein
MSADKKYLISACIIAALILIGLTSSGLFSMTSRGDLPELPKQMDGTPYPAASTWEGKSEKELVDYFKSNKGQCEKVLGEGKKEMGGLCVLKSVGPWRIEYDYAVEPLKSRKAPRPVKNVRYQFLGE